MLRGIVLLRVQASLLNISSTFQLLYQTPCWFNRHASLVPHSRSVKVLSSLASAAQMGKPPQLDIGTSLQSGRYQIIADQSGCQADYPTYQVQHTYIAQDRTPTPRCISLRIFQKGASTTSATTHELKLLRSLNRAADLHQYVLAPRQTFFHTTQEGKNLCLVYEDLFGPDLWFMSEVVGPEMGLLPAAMIWKIAKQALESLAFLHRHGICHGSRYTPLQLSACIS